MRAGGDGLGVRVLVVDDDPGFLEGVVDLLELSGVEARGCARVAGALEAAGEARYDLALVDVKMPGATGLHLASELRRRQADLPIVWMTGFSLEQAADYALGDAKVVVDASTTAPQALPNRRAVFWVTGRPGGRGHVERLLRAAEREPVGVALDDLGGVRARPGQVALVELEVSVARALERCVELGEPLGPAVFLSRYDRTLECDPLRCLEVTGFLFKPFSAEELLRVVRRAG